jgi:hypothetical protein
MDGSNANDSQVSLSRLLLYSSPVYLNVYMKSHLVLFASRQLSRACVVLRTITYREHLLI